MTVKFWEAVRVVYFGDTRIEIEKPDYETLKKLVMRAVGD